MLFLLVDLCILVDILYELYVWIGNCEYNGVYVLCDCYIVLGWYKSDDFVLDNCLVFNSCGVVYLIWMNG